MPSQRNVQQLADLKVKVSGAKSMIFADHSGMSVVEQQDLRAKLKAVGGELMVAKNTLLKLALGQKELFQGPTSIVIARDDEILPIKVLAEFAKGHEKPTIKAGFLGEKSLSVAEIVQLAQLPGKEELLGQLLRQMQAPAVGLVRVLNGTMEKLVWALEARRKRLATSG